MCYNVLMIKRFLPILTAVSAISICIVVNFTTPSAAGPFGVLVLFLSLYILFVGIITFLILGMSKLFRSIINRNRSESTSLDNKTDRYICVKKAYYYGSILALLPVLLLAMQSFGGVAIAELCLITVFCILGCLLVSRK